MLNSDRHRGVAGSQRWLVPGRMALACARRAPCGVVRIAMALAAVPRAGAPRGGAAAGLPFSVAIGPAGQCPCRINSCSKQHQNVYKTQPEVQFSRRVWVFKAGISAVQCPPVGSQLTPGAPWSGGGLRAIGPSRTLKHTHVLLPTSAGDTKKCTFAIKYGHVKWR